MSYRRALKVVLMAIWIGSCAVARPEIQLTISGTAVPSSRENSFCQPSGCTVRCVDGPSPEAPLTIVRANAPVQLEFSAGPEVNRIHGDIYEGERMVGSPIEAFTLTGNERTHPSASMRAGRYYILISIAWSRLTDRGDFGRAFLVDITPHQEHL